MDDTQEYEMTYLEIHNQYEHNFHTDWQNSGFDVCIECELIRKTGGVYDWKEEELVSEEFYFKSRRESYGTK